MLARSAVVRGWHDIEVIVLRGNGRAVTTWGFTGCHLVALRYTPIDEVEADLLMETAEISFETVTQIAHR